MFCHLIFSYIKAYFRNHNSWHLELMFLFFFSLTPEFFRNVEFYEYWYYYEILLIHFLRNCIFCRYHGSMLRIEERRAIMNDCLRRYQQVSKSGLGRLAFIPLVNKIKLNGSVADEREMGYIKRDTVLWFEVSSHPVFADLHEI